MEDLLEPDALAVRGDDRPEGVIPFRAHVRRAEFRERGRAVRVALGVMPDIGSPSEGGQVPDPGFADRRLELRPDFGVALVVFRLGARIEPQAEAGAIHIQPSHAPGPPEGGPGDCSKYEGVTSLQPRRSPFVDPEPPHEDPKPGRARR